MDKKQLIKKIESAWQDLHNSFVGLTEEELTQPGAAGDWSVKDLLAHVTAWELEGLKHLPAILAGERTPRYSDVYGGIDAFNARMFEKNRGKRLSEVLRDMEATHRRVLEFVRDAPDDEIVRETRFRRRLRFDTYRHYKEHSEMIRTWREGASGSDPE